jgi:hypothetical protein
MTIPRVLIAVRDLLVPGQVFGFIPNDDTYLKVMNASSKGGVADMFFSQLQALYMLILCLYKWWTIFVWLGSGFGGGTLPNLWWLFGGAQPTTTSGTQVAFGRFQRLLL